jgi:tripartite-type tricarboxylate transporter receptor subunit TctC
LTIAPRAHDRRRLLVIARRHMLLGGLSLLMSGAGARAQDVPYPQKTVTFLVASSAGSGTDIVARLLAERMRDDLGQPIIVENRPGAAGNIGAAYVANGPKDGHTILLTAGALAIAPSVYEKLSYDPLKDLTGVAWLATVPLIVVTKPKNGLTSMQDVFAMAKRDPDSVTFGSFGMATPSHLAGESINQAIGLKLRHVPYNRGGASTDTMSGTITIAILDAFSTMPLVQAGELKALAVTGPRRLQALPDVPTLSESGVPFETVGWHGAFAPTGTPTAVIERLNAAFRKALAAPGMADRIVAGGSVPIDPPATAQQWDAQFRRDVESWAKVARAAEIRIK